MRCRRLLALQKQGAGISADAVLCNSQGKNPLINMGLAPFNFARAGVFLEYDNVG